MRCTLEGLLCVGLMLGCIGPNGDDVSERPPANDPDEEPPASPPGRTDGEEADAGRTFRYRPPTGRGRSYKGGLKVVARGEARGAGEGYRVRIFGLVPRGPGEKARRVTLAEQDVFRPPGPGEETTIVVDEVKPEAWVAGKDGDELRLGVEILPALPGRKPPEASLKVVDAKPED